eukprot:g18157.t1
MPSVLSKYETGGRPAQKVAGSAYLPVELMWSRTRTLALEGILAPKTAKEKGAAKKWNANGPPPAKMKKPAEKRKLKLLDHFFAGIHDRRKRPAFATVKAAFAKSKRPAA